MNPSSISSKKRLLLLCLNIFFVLLVGLVDWQTGFEVQVFVFDFIPVAIIAWYCGLAPTIFISILSASVWLAADVGAGHEYSHFTILYWETLIRLLCFLAIGISMSKIKFLLDEERRIRAELQKVISEVKTLRGLIPICCICKKIRNDDGYWQQMESYISAHSEVLFSHGFCSECAKKEFKDSGIELDDAEIAEMERANQTKLEMASPATKKNSEDRRQ